MNRLLHIFTKKDDRNQKNACQLLGSNPLFYKALSVDKKIYKIKRRKWN